MTTSYPLATSTWDEKELEAIQSVINRDMYTMGESVASFENNQSPATKIHNQFIIAQDGYYDIEMFWWDQGGAYVFKPEISSDGGLTYKTLDSTMLFTKG